jgi:3-oxoacyl-[acyl-carrier protein] reductase
MLPFDLTGRRALVTGGSKGIGLAVARQLASLGATVCIVARDAESLETALQSLSAQHNQEHRAIAADLNDTSSLSRWITDLLIEGPIHILINNAGGPPAGPISGAKIPDFESALRLHLFSAHTLSLLCLPAMRDSGYGRIVNIISTSVKQPLDNLGVSNTTRAAMAGWSKTLANEVARFGITVNNVLPGATRTGRLASIITNASERRDISTNDVETELLAEIPMRRFAEPEEIASAVAFLASPAAAYITGHSLPVDGGRIKGL